VSGFTERKIKPSNLEKVPWSADLKSEVSTAPQIGESAMNKEKSPLSGSKKGPGTTPRFLLQYRL